MCSRAGLDRLWLTVEISKRKVVEARVGLDVGGSCAAPVNCSTAIILYFDLDGVAGFEPYIPP
jgi:hypothetical protein